MEGLCFPKGRELRKHTGTRHVGIDTKSIHFIKKGAFFKKPVRPGIEPLLIKPDSVTATPSVDELAYAILIYWYGLFCLEMLYLKFIQT